MSEELFPEAAVHAESPRLRWIKKHRVQTHKSAHLSGDEQPWSAWTGELCDAIDDMAIGHGATEDDAVTAWARLSRVQLWHEEGL